MPNYGQVQTLESQTSASWERFVLTNSSLSSMPTYMMGMFLLHEGTHKQMDAIRSQNFDEEIARSPNIIWSSGRMFVFSEKLKYHMVLWDNVCLPTDFGGLIIINTRHMNDALLLKWVWRIYQNSIEDICCQLLREKYLRNKSLMMCMGCVRSQFWRGVNKIKHNFNWGPFHGQ